MRDPSASDAVVVVVVVVLSRQKERQHGKNPHLPSADPCCMQRRLQHVEASLLHLAASCSSTLLLCPTRPSLEYASMIPTWIAAEVSRVWVFCFDKDGFTNDSLHSLDFSHGSIEKAMASSWPP